jgi:adenylylsulfate kinase
VTSRPPGFTLWFTGLSGAGKSTLASEMSRLLADQQRRIEILDGDEVRLHLSKGLGFSKEDRDTNIRRIGYVARLLSRNGVVAITAAISPYQQARDEVRRSHDAPFVEVFVDCAVEDLVRRDTKGLYARALRGELANFTGVSDPYEPPSSPEIHVTTGRQTVGQSTAVIVDYLRRRELMV